MTPEQHNKYLGISHIAFGGFFCLMMAVVMVFFGAAIGLSRSGGDGPPLLLFLFIWLFVALIYGAMAIPSFVAGYGLLKRKRWAKTAAIVAGVMAAMSFPMGTAVCVYTFWFLFSEPGKTIFDQPRQGLPPRRQEWANQTTPHQQQQKQYVPPPTPPDWR